MAAPFIRHQGVAAVLDLANIDTDQIIPSREIRTVGRTGLADGLFAGWRYTAPGGREPSADFALNQPAYRGASILIAGENFGCGSSRKHAAWALAEFGFRAILAPSFGDIFFANCTRNGIVPACVDAGALVALAAHVQADPQAHLVCVDLAAQIVSVTGDGAFEARFEIAPLPQAHAAGGAGPDRGDAAGCAHGRRVP